MNTTGNRVGAIMSADPKTKIVNLAGFGVYKGDEVPPTGLTCMCTSLHEMQRKNPRIDLDNGHTIWGCQCWWGEEEPVKKMIEAYIEKGYTINTTDPKAYVVAKGDEG